LSNRFGTTTFASYSIEHHASQLGKPSFRPDLLFLASFAVPVIVRIKGVIYRYPGIMEDIRRKRGDYKAAVEKLAAGHVAEGFDRLDTMGAIKPMPAADLYGHATAISRHAERDTGNPYHLCSAHLARITRCKFLQPLRYLCQFMYLTTVKHALRNSFDLNYLRKMCGTWVDCVSAVAQGSQIHI